MEQHLQDLFDQHPPDSDGASSEAVSATIAEDLDPLPSSEDAELICANAAKSDWISKAGCQDRGVKGNFYRRKADLFLSKTDPGASPIKR